VLDNGIYFGKAVSGSIFWQSRVWKYILALRNLLLRNGTSVSERHGAIMRTSEASKPRFKQT
jgi:outer membrane biogenesis lipoprotein LolB